MRPAISMAILCVAAVVAAGGCAVQHDGPKLAKYRAGDGVVLDRVPSDGTYFCACKWRGGGGVAGALEGTEVVLRRGETVGFRAEQGTLIAVAGADEFPVSAAPAAAEYYCWYRAPGRGGTSADGPSADQVEDAGRAAVAVAAWLGVELLVAAISPDHDCRWAREAPGHRHGYTGLDGQGRRREREGRGEHARRTPPASQPSIR